MDGLSSDYPFTFEGACSDSCGIQHDKPACGNSYSHVRCTLSRVCMTPPVRTGQCPIKS